MNAGIFVYFGYPLNYVVSAGMISRAGFKSVMLWWDKDEANVPKEKQPELFRKHGLEIANAHLPYGNVNDLWNDNANGQGYFEKLTKGVADCGEHGIPAAVVHISSGFSPPPPNKTGLERLKRLAALGEKHNVYVALENMKRIDYLDYVFGNIDSKYLAFCYDSGHEHGYGQYPGTDLLEKFGDRLVTVHLHDNDATDDQHLMPFNGTASWDVIMARLKKTGYKGDLLFENGATDAEIKIYTPEQYLDETMTRAVKLYNKMNEKG